MSVGRFDIELLEAYVAIADTGSFTRASELLHRTQPSVSMQIKRLEHRVGKTLVKRKQPNILFTEDGQTMLNYARRIVDLVEEARQHMSVPELSGVVRVGLPEWFAKDRLQTMLCRFAMAHPSIKLEMHVGDSAMLYEKLNNDQLDVGLMIRNPADQPTRIWEEPLYWVAAKDYEIENVVPLCLFVKPCPYRQLAVSSLTAAGREFKESFVSTSVAAVCASLNSGMGVSILPAGAIAPGLRILQESDGFSDLPPMELAVYSSNADQSLAIKHLTDYLTEHVADAIMQNNPMIAGSRTKNRAAG